MEFFIKQIFFFCIKTTHINCCVCQLYYLYLQFQYKYKEVWKMKK